tara:strand:+ start:13405 stop:13866 length:462 start_codon:yes stop_codon:yes gene_type:complete
VGFRDYFVSSLKTALETSKVGLLKNKIITKYHRVKNSKDFNQIKINSNRFTKFHSIFYRDHILELANDLSNQEQEVASEILAEPEINYYIEEESEDKQFKNIEDLIEPVQSFYEYSSIPEGASVKKIIVMKGEIREKIYITKENKEIKVSFNL